MGFLGVIVGVFDVVFQIISWPFTLLYSIISWPAKKIFEGGKKMKYDDINSIQSKQPQSYSQANYDEVEKLQSPPYQRQQSPRAPPPMSRTMPPPPGDLPPPNMDRIQRESRESVMSEDYFKSERSLSRNDYILIAKLLKASHTRLWNTINDLVKSKDIVGVEDCARDIEEIELIYKKLQQYLS